MADWPGAVFEADQTHWPEELLARKQFMGHDAKRPRATWTDPNAPAVCTSDTCQTHDDAHARCDACRRHKGDEEVTTAECGHSAQFKWSYTGNHTTGEDAIEWSRMDPRLDRGVAFLQQDDDPYLYVDGDDVRDPATGEVHPAFVALLEHLGLTYADISLSGAGVHAMYRGRLPGDVGKAAWQIDDEPWGANDDVPSIELYPGKRVCVMTGDHVAGTPEGIKPITDDVLEPLLEANDQLWAGGENSANLPDDYEPDATSSDEYTDDKHDIFHALDQLDCREVAERTIVHRWNDSASTSRDVRAFYPTWGPDSNGTANIVHPEKGWKDTGDEGGHGKAATMAAIDAGIISHRNAGPVSGEDWWEAVEHLRELGFDIPRYESSVGDDDPFDPRYVASFPETPEVQRSLSSWNPDPRGSDKLTKGEVHERVEKAVDAVQSNRKTALLNVIMGAGKTHSALKVSAQTERPTFYATRRREMMREAREMATEVGHNGDDIYTMPSAPRLCPTFKGKHGDEWEDFVTERYGEKDARPSKLHERFDLPCEDGDKECPYRQMLNADLDDYGLIIGHYNHTYLPHAVGGRHVVVDEYDRDATLTELVGDRLERWVNAWLEDHDTFPYDDYHDLLSDSRCETDRKDTAIEWFRQHPPERDEEGALQNRYHVHTAQAVYTILAGTPVGDEDYPFQRARIPGLDHRRYGLFFYGDSHSSKKVTLQTPPDLGYARSVLALDGTPDVGAWENWLGERTLKEIRVLDDEERETFVRDVLGLVGIHANDNPKPYSSGKWVSPERDAALIQGVAEQYGEPVVFTAKKAIAEYRKHDVPGRVDASAFDNFMNLRGSNEYADGSVAVINGSTHYGDNWVKTLAALDGMAVEPEGKGTERDYGYAERYVKLMREANVVQAAMRIGRNGQGGVVVFNTEAYPDWFPVVGEAAVPRLHSENQQDILLAMRDLDSRGERLTTGTVHDHERVDCARETVRRNFKKFAEWGYITVEREGGRRMLVAQDDGLHRVNDEGVVELPATDDEELAAIFDPPEAGEDDTHTPHMVTLMPSVGVRNAEERGLPGSAEDLLVIKEDADDEVLKATGPPD